ncbi:tectonin domain-containing protein [Nonomuraea dietziae]|uniref:tectonin domain-containing protein n=1 Tax=Nonomuraea dietziae TaxID=65515 RepID=UPI00340A9A9E
MGASSRARAVEAARAGEWQQLPGLASRLAAGPTALWGISSSGAVQRWTGSGWALEGGPATRISVSADSGSLPWIVRPNGNIWRRTLEGPWRQVAGTGVDIAAGGADNTWTLGSGGIFRWNGSGWTRADGSAARIAAGSSGEVWIIDPNGRIYRRSSDRWELKPGSGVDIAVASPTRVAITSVDREAYLWTGSDWRQLPGVDAVSIAIDNQHVYALDPAGKIWKLNA